MGLDPQADPRSLTEGIWAARTAFARLQALVTSAKDRDEQLATELAEALTELETIGRDAASAVKKLEALTQEVMQERERYLELFETNPNAQVLTTPEGRVTLANAAARALFGLGDVTTRQLHECIPANQRETYDRALEAVFSGSALVRDVISLGTDERVTALASFIVGAVEGATGIHLRWVFHDITSPTLRAVRVHDRQLRAVKARIAAVDAHTQAFIASIGHDLRNPLHATTGLIDTLLQHDEELAGEKRTALLRAARANATLLNRMLEGLLERASLTSFEAQEPTRVDLPTIVHRTLAGLAPHHHPVQVADDVAIAMTDELLARRIVFNALTNVIQHTPPTTPIRVWFSSTEHEVIVAIEDDGPGMSTASKALLNAPVDLPPGGDATTAGVGLGLIARFSAMLGGRAWFEDREQGTRICIALPRAPDQAEALSS